MGKALLQRKRVLSYTGNKLIIHVMQCRGPGCLSRIRIFPPRIRVKKVPGPGSSSASKNLSDDDDGEFKYLSILNPENCTKLAETCPGCSSRIRMLILYPSRIPDPGVKMAPESGSATLSYMMLIYV